MNIDDPKPRRLRLAGLAAAGVAGAVLAAAGVAAANSVASTSTPADSAPSANSSASSNGSSSSSDSGSGNSSLDDNGSPDDRGSFDPGGSSPVRSDEKSVSSSRTKELSAAALEKVPGATVIRVETDAGDGEYEVHMRKADGSLVTVKFDKNLKVIEVQDGMGTGDPAPQGGPGGRGHGGRDGDRGATSGSTSSASPTA